MYRIGLFCYYSNVLGSGYTKREEVKERQKIRKNKETMLPKEERVFKSCKGNNCQQHRPALARASSCVISG
jgi:hypothetical protein